MKFKYFYSLPGAFLVLLSILPFSGKSQEFRNGMVVSAHPEASKAGVEILRQGGNAVDAAVAVQFALAVVYPSAGNIGGGGFMVYRSKSGQTATLDYREKAPAGASRDMYLDATGNPIPGKSLRGHLASGVPGSVDGMVQAHKKYGRLPWKQLVQPAVDLAEKGFTLSDGQASDLNRSKANFSRYNEVSAFVKQTSEWQSGEKLVQPELAKTLKLIRDKGRAGFYEGPVAEMLTAEMKRGSGLITGKDLKNYHSVWRTPVTGMYKGYKIITMPPPSSGGIALVQLLGSIERFPLKRWGFGSDSTIQVMVEAERRVYADRATHLGDPDFYKVPQKQMLESPYILSRMNNFNWAKATPSSEISAGKLTPKESEETTHFSITDREGNAVSVTTTLNGSYGSLVIVKGAGFFMNNEMDDFSAKAGVPNMYGLVGGDANSIAPNKRMLSSMTPTIIEKDGRLFMVAGTPGGSTIITSVFQTILNVIEFNKTMQEAVAAPRFHHQWLPDEVSMEAGRLGNSLKENLKNKGYKITERGSIGRVDAILVTPQGYQGGADPRGDDTVIGW